MCIRAIEWAWSVETPSSSCKLVLLAFANHANSDLKSWPSIQRICEMTGLNRKTALHATKKLVDCRLLTVTDDKSGGTNRVNVYRLEAGNSPKFGTVKQSQKRNSTENGTVPNLEGNGPKIGTLNRKEPKEQSTSLFPDTDVSSKSSVLVQSSICTTPDGMTKGHNGHAVQDRVPYQRIVDLFNEKCGNAGLRRVLNLNETRKKAIRARFKECDEGKGLEETVSTFGIVFDKVIKSDHLMGKKSDWQATFDWIMTARYFVRIAEGNYENRKR